MDLDEAQRAIERVLQLHTADPHASKIGITVAVCKHCRREDGGRVMMPCPTARILRRVASRL